jgi:hypothetical protein
MLFCWPGKCSAILIGRFTLQRFFADLATGPSSTNAPLAARSNVASLSQRSTGGKHKNRGHPYRSFVPALIANRRTGLG